MEGTSGLDQPAYSPLSTSDAPLSAAGLSHSRSGAQSLQAPLGSSLWFWMPLLLLLLLLATAGAIISGASSPLQRQAHMPAQPADAAAALTLQVGPSEASEPSDPSEPPPPPPAPAYPAPHCPSPADPSVDAAAPLRVALCFFGQVKNLSHVVSSIRRNILAPLRESNATVDIFAHTYSLDSIENPRAGEKASILPDSISMLRRDARSLTVWYTHTELVDNKRPREFYLTNGNPWPGTHNNTLLFYVRQLHSLEYCTGLWADDDGEQQPQQASSSSARSSPPSPPPSSAAASPFDFVIYLRPDVRFFTRLPPLNRSLCDDEVVVPDFQHWGGVNDRFAYGRPRAMALYGRRVRYISTYFRRHKHSLHAECFLQRFLGDHQLRVREARIRFGRVRANGGVHAPDVCKDPDCDMNA